LTLLYAYSRGFNAGLGQILEHRRGYKVASTLVKNRFHEILHSLTLFVHFAAACPVAIKTFRRRPQCGREARPGLVRVETVTVDNALLGGISEQRACRVMAAHIFQLSGGAERTESGCRGEIDGYFYMPLVDNVGSLGSAVNGGSPMVVTVRR
jgi:hypothetical protein